MSDSVAWFRDTALVRSDKVTQFWPNNNQSTADRVNVVSIHRVRCAFLPIRRDLRTSFSAMALAILYVMHENGMIEASMTYVDQVDGGDATCRPPTADNPMANVMLTDTGDELPACAYDKVANFTKHFAEDRIMYDSGRSRTALPVHQRRAHARQFINVPGHAEDQTAFAEWLYGKKGAPSCRTDPTLCDPNARGAHRSVLRSRCILVEVNFILNLVLEYNGSAAFRTHNLNAGVIPSVKAVTKFSSTLKIRATICPSARTRCCSARRRTRQERVLRVNTSRRAMNSARNRRPDSARPSFNRRSTLSSPCTRIWHPPRCPFRASTRRRAPMFRTNFSVSDTRETKLKSYRIVEMADPISILAVAGLVYAGRKLSDDTPVKPTTAAKLSNSRVRRRRTSSTRKKWIPCPRGNRRGHPVPHHAEA